jgi:hypothetical protein
VSLRNIYATPGVVHAVFELRQSRRWPLSDYGTPAWIVELGGIGRAASRTDQRNPPAATTDSLRLTYPFRRCQNQQRTVRRS